MSKFEITTVLFFKYFLLVFQDFVIGTCNTTHGKDGIVDDLNMRGRITFLNLRLKQLLNVTEN
jgi:hypothetical protein